MKSYKNGGLTYDQFLYMVKSAADKDYADKRFDASLQGVDLDKATKRSSTSDSSSSEAVFKSPEEYEKMAPEQRAAATMELMKKMRQTGLVAKEA